MGRLCCFIVILMMNLRGVFGANKYSRDDFPADFIFGSGTSAYQVEGAAFEDGRTPSIWDTFAHFGMGPGGNGDVACNTYHKYKEDVQLMVDIGLDAYRFSISWSRLIPNGRGPVNPKGLQYYNNLIDQLISHGIQPHISLYNYDLPQALEDEYGGWVNRKIVKDFTEYADVCFREFGDRVVYWTTVNEPNVMTMGGYDSGIAPPQRCSSPFGVFNCSRGDSSTEPYLVVHHALLAHASAARLYQKKYKDKQHGYVGLSIYMYWPIPLSDTIEDVNATKRVMDFFTGWVMDPLVFGDYPETMKEIVGERLPAFTKTESRLVKGAFDFIGVIHYMVIYIKDNPESRRKEKRDYISDAGVTLIVAESKSSAFEIPVEPWGLQAVLEYFKQVYGNPTLYIYENGQSMLRNSTLEDTSRVEYLSAYIGAVLDSLRNGSNTRGYFTWSLLDAYELLSGYESGYGLIYVDLDDPNFRRYPKLSATWYSHFLKGNTILDSVDEVDKNPFALS